MSSCAALFGAPQHLAPQNGARGARPVRRRCLASEPDYACGGNAARANTNAARNGTCYQAPKCAATTKAVVLGKALCLLCVCMCVRVCVEPAQNTTVTVISSRSERHYRKQKTCRRVRGSNDRQCKGPIPVCCRVMTASR